MATEVGSAFVSIVPSLRGFSSATQRELSRSGLNRQASTAGTRAGDAFTGGFTTRTRVGLNRSGIFTGLSTSARSFAPIVGVATGAVVAFGLKTASSIQQARVGFTTMLGSAKRAKVFLAGLSKFAKTTPFDLPGVTTSSQKLLAFGFRAKQVIPTLTALGDAAAGLSLGAEGLDRLTTAVGQIQAKGKVQSDELLQLTEAGVPALKILANQFGTTTTEMQAMVTKGLVPANKAIPALLSGLERGTRGAAGKTAKFAGLMDKQSRTLGGVFSNIKDTVVQGLGKAFLPLARSLSGSLPKILPGIAAGFRSLGGFITAAIPPVQRFAGFFADRILPVLKTVGGVMVSFARGILPSLQSAFNSVADAIRSHQDDFAAVGKAIFAVGKVLLRVFGTEFAVQMRVSGKVLGFIINIAGSLVGFFRGPFVRGVGSAVSFIVRGFKFLLDVWGTVVGGIIHGAAAAFGWVPGVGGKLKGAADAFDSFKAHADAVLSGIAADAGQWGAATGQNFVHGFASIFSIFDAVGGVFENLKIGDPGKAAGVANTSVPAFSATGVSLGKATGDGIAKGAKDSTAKVAKSFADLADKILGPLRALVGRARDLAKSIADGITGSLGLGSLVTSTDSLGSQFSTSLSGIISGLASQRSLVRKFRHQIQQLENRGLSESAIRDIVAMGAQDGSAFAATLLSGTRKQIRRISRLNRGINRGAAGLGTDVASDVFGRQIAREVRRTTQAVEKASKNTELGEKTMRRLDRSLHRLERRGGRYLDTVKLDKKQGREVVIS